MRRLDPLATLRTRPARPPNRFWIVKERVEAPIAEARRSQSQMITGIFAVLLVTVGILFVANLIYDQKPPPTPTPSRGPDQPSATARPTRPPGPTARPAGGSPMRDAPEDLKKLLKAVQPHRALLASLETSPTDGGNYEVRLRALREIFDALDKDARNALFGTAAFEELTKALTAGKVPKEKLLHRLLQRAQLCLL